MIKQENKEAMGYVPMNFSLTIETKYAFKQFCKKHKIKYSKMLQMIIKHFKDHPKELTELTERYF